MNPSGNKKPHPDFVVRLVGPGIKPWAIPMRSLARVLDAIQRLVDQRDDEIEGDDRLAEDHSAPEMVDTESRALRLVDMKARSAGYAVAAPVPDLALGVLRRTGSDIESPEAADWSNASLSSLKELSEVAKSLGCEIE